METLLERKDAAGSVDGEALLEQVLSATRHTERSYAKDLLRTLTDEAQRGIVSWNKNLTVTINEAVNAIDDIISKQLAAVMHSEKFQRLEGSWRGLAHLVENADTGQQLKIRVLNASQKELQKDLAKAVEFDQSQLFKKIYEAEFGTAGGEPFGVLIGDYEFSNSADDIDTLAELSHVAAASFCPFISAASPAMFGFESFTDLSKPRDLEKVFDSSEYAKWRGFRESEDARFVTLTLPRVLARLPYGKNGKVVDAFNYEEFPVESSGKSVSVDHNQYCWMNASYMLGEVLTRAFSEYGWCTAIRGAEGGGKVAHLPSHVFVSEDGDLDQKCPTEIGLTERRDFELSKLGFLPLCHYKNTDYAVFFGAQSAQRPKKYSDLDATANAAISARLPYIMATSRIAHYLKVMARDKVGSFMEAQDAERWLNDWIKSYCNANPEAGQDSKARYPLAEARVEVRENPGQPGVYSAIAYLRPWLQMEELTASLRMVANIPTTNR